MTKLRSKLCERIDITNYESDWLKKLAHLHYGSE